MFYSQHCTPCQCPPPPPPTDCGANRCQVTPPQGVGGWGAVIGLRAGRSLRYFLTFADDRIGTCSSIRRVKPCQRLKAHSCVVGYFFLTSRGFSLTTVRVSALSAEEGWSSQHLKRASNSPQLKRQER